MRSFTVLSISISVLQTAQDWVREFRVPVLQGVSQASAHTRAMLVHPCRCWQDKCAGDLLTLLTNKCAACCLQMANNQRTAGQHDYKQQPADAVGCKGFESITWCTAEQQQQGSTQQRK